MNFHLNILGHSIFMILLLFLVLKPIYPTHAALMKNINNDRLPGSTKAALMIVSMKFVYTGGTCLMSVANSILQSKITNVCCQDDVDRVVLAGDWDNFEIRNRNFPISMPIRIYGMSQRKMHKHYQRMSGSYKIDERIASKLYYPARIFVISTRDHRFLHGTLEHLKNTTVWDSRAFFIVIEKSHNGSCSDVSLSIETIWKFNILNSIFLCNGSEDNMNFYNFNPYTSHFVRPWKLIDEIFDDDRNHTTSVLHFSTTAQDFKATVCGSLNFDKTKTIDKYPIKMAGATSPALFENITELKTINFLHNFKGIDAKINKIIWAKLGANPTIKIYDQGYIDSEHVPHGSIKEVIKGKYDMGVNQHFSRNFWRLQTYPHPGSGIYALSLEDKPDVHARVMISEPVMYVIIVLVSTFTIISLKYHLKMKVAQAFEANMKLLLGVPVRYVGSGRKKWFLMYLTVVSFVVRLFLESTLSSSLVLPNSHFSIDSKDDLLAAVNLGYKVFGPAFVRELLNDNITKAFYPERLTRCAKKLHTRSKSVCLSDGFAINKYAKHVDERVHISERRIENRDFVFLVREDWPLRARVDFLIQQLKESGILRHFFKIKLFVVQEHHAKHSKLEEHAPFRDLSLKSLDFSMLILFTGLVVAFFAFVAERIKRARHYRRIGKNRRKLNNLNMFKRNRS